MSLTAEKKIDDSDSRSIDTHVTLVATDIEQSEKAAPPASDVPDGGLQAWLTVAGAYVRTRTQCQI